MGPRWSSGTDLPSTSICVLPSVRGSVDGSAGAGNASEVSGLVFKPDMLQMYDIPRSCVCLSRYDRWELKPKQSRGVSGGRDLDRITALRWLRQPYASPAPPSVGYSGLRTALRDIFLSQFSQAQTPLLPLSPSEALEIALGDDPVAVL